MAQYNPNIPVGFTDPHDYNLSLMLTVDPWDLQNEDKLLSDPKLWAKASASLGIIVQKSFYEQSAANAKLDPEARKEFMIKLLNVFQTEKQRDWIKADKIRSLQTQHTINELSSDFGWVTIVGFDFSMGDDIYAASYLCVNTETGEMFADLDAWVAEEEATKSALWPLYKEWIEKGWLHMVPGATFGSTIFLTRIAEIAEHLDILAFAYDPYKAKNYLNDLSAWLVEKGSDPKNTLISVRQNFATYNPLVLEMSYMIQNEPSLIRFSPSPLWPWEFANAQVAESNDGMGNLKVIKSGHNAKVDNVQCLMNALYAFDLLDGRYQVNR